MDQEIRSNNYDISVSTVEDTSFEAMDDSILEIIDDEAPEIQGKPKANISTHFRNMLAMFGNFLSLGFF